MVLKKMWAPSGCKNIRKSAQMQPSCIYFMMFANLDIIPRLGSKSFKLARKTSNKNEKNIHGLFSGHFYEYWQ